MHTKKHIKLLVLIFFPFALINAFGSDQYIINEIINIDLVDHQNASLSSPDTLRTKEKSEEDEVMGRNLHLLWNHPEYAKLSNYDSLKLNSVSKMTLPISNIKIEKIKLNHDVNNGFFKSTTFKVMLGSAVLLGGTAAYFKIKGDNKYETYLMNKYHQLLDEVNLYDLYSGIAFGLLQINFGYLLYKFIIE